jgi:hypothetical protein
MQSLLLLCCLSLLIGRCFYKLGEVGLLGAYVQLIDRERENMVSKLTSLEQSQHSHYNYLSHSLPKFDKQHALIKPYLNTLTDLIVEYFQLILLESCGRLPSSVVSQLLFSSEDPISNKVLSLEQTCILKLRENLDLEQLHMDTLKDKLHISSSHRRLSY